MNAQELKDFQEKERIEKERQQKEEQAKKEQQEKAQKEKETYQKAQEKARKPHSDLDKAREKMRKTEHQAMREAVKQQVADRQQTAKEGASGPQVIRDQGQQAEADKYGQMRQNDAKMALGTVGKAHGSPEMQGLHGTKEFEAAQATAAFRAQGEQKPWKAAQHSDHHHEQESAHKGKDDHGGPDRVVRDGGPDRPGPAPAPAHAHAGHHAKPWHEKHGGHPDHLGTILTDKAHAPLEGGTPWQHQADPDRAESRMAAQAREREQEQSR